MFETHKLNELGFKVVKEFKEDLSLAISKAMVLIPEGRDKSIFKTKIEEAVFFGTRGIASDKNNHTEVINYAEYKP